MQTLNESWKLFRQKNYAQAIEHLEKDSPTYEVDKLIFHIYQLTAEGERSLNQAEQECTKALSKARELNYCFGVGYALFCQANLHHIRGHLKEAGAKIEEAKKSFEACKADYGILDCKNFIGVLEYAGGNYQRAEAIYSDIYALSLKLQSIPDIIRSANNLAVIMDVQDRTDEAHQLYIETLEIAKTSKGGSYYFSTLYNNIGGIESAHGQYRQAEASYIQAIHYALKDGRLDAVAFSYSNLSRVYTDKAEFTKAYEAITKAMDYYNQAGIKHDMPYVYASYASLFLTQGRFKEAEDYYKTSIASFRELEVNNEHYIMTLCAYAEVLDLLGRDEEAYEYLRTANRIAQLRGSIDEQLSIDSATSKLALARGKGNIDLAIYLAEENIARAETERRYISVINGYLTLAEATMYKIKLGTSQDLQKAHTIINKIVELSESKKLIPYYIRAQFLHSILLASTQEGIEQGIKLLNEVMKLAETHGIINLKSQGKDLAERLTKRTLSETEIIDELLWSIKSITHRMVVTKELRALLDETHMLLITQTPIGADVKVAENFDLSKKEFLFKFAMFLSIAIGQGQNYHHGLFGPLPVPEVKDKLTIIYSFSVKDEKMFDARAKKHNFVMIAFVMGAEVSNFFDNRTIIRKIYEEYMSKITDLKQIDTEFLGSLRQRLLSRCVPEWSSTAD